MIDPTKPGPDADRIAEWEREIAEQEDLAARCLTEHKYIFHGRAQFLRAELARLRSEQPKGGDAELRRDRIAEAKFNQSLTQGPGSECDRSGADRFPPGSPVLIKGEVVDWGSTDENRIVRAGGARGEWLPVSALIEAPNTSPAPSPEPQDVREAWVECDYENVYRVCIETPAQVCEFKVGPKHFADDLAKAINEHVKLAALAQSDAQPNTERRLRLQMLDISEHAGAHLCRAEKAEAELSDIAAAIGSPRFMDPPDGGDVSLAEQARRMRQALEAAEEQSDAQPVGEAVQEFEPCEKVGNGDVFDCTWPRCTCIRKRKLALVPSCTDRSAP